MARKGREGSDPPSRVVRALCAQDGTGLLRYVRRPRLCNDDGLVAHAVVARAERHQEDRELAELRVANGERVLLHQLAAGRDEPQRERHPPHAVDPVLALAVARLVAARQHGVDRLALGGDELEALADVGRERPAREDLRVRHGREANAGARARSA